MKAAGVMRNGGGHQAAALENGIRKSARQASAAQARPWRRLCGETIRVWRQWLAKAQLYGI